MVERMSGDLRILVHVVSLCQAWPKLHTRTIWTIEDESGHGGELLGLARSCSSGYDGGRGKRRVDLEHQTQHLGLERIGLKAMKQRCPATGSWIKARVVLRKTNLREKWMSWPAYHCCCNPQVANKLIIIQSYRYNLHA